MREVFPLLEIFRQFTWSQLLFFSGLMLSLDWAFQVKIAAASNESTSWFQSSLGWYNLLYRFNTFPLPAEFNQPLYPPAWLLPCISVGLAALIFTGILHLHLGCRVPGPFLWLVH